MTKIPFALQAYSLNETFAEYPLETLRFIRNAGYTGVEFYGSCFSPEFHAALLKETGLVCTGWHTGIDDLEGEHFETTLRRNIAVGNHTICVPWFNAPTIAEWETFAGRLNTAAEKLAPWGIRLGFHNHPHEFLPVDGKIPWEVVAENTDQTILLQLDIGNCMESGTDVLHWLKKYPGRAKTIHCKPWSKDGKFDFCKGDDAPWKEILEWCRSEGGTEWFIVEYEEKKDNRACIRKIIEKLSAF